MDIRVSGHQGDPRIRIRTVRRKLKAILNDLGCRDRELSVLFVGDDEMTRLNRRYLKREGSTNVIAFPMVEKGERDMDDGFFETLMLGDVVVCPDKAAREAKAAGISVEEMVDRLLIHGILHLLGYDHEASLKDAIIMENEEKRLLEMVREG